jgi:hypothetical protein
VTNLVEDSVSILLGNGDGTFQAAASYRSFGKPISVAVADVNGDGKADLVTSNSAADTVSVLLGNGDGSFRPAVYYQVGSGPGAAVVADFNGDGKPDIAVENFGSDSVSVLLGNGDGTFRTAMKYGAGWGPGGLAVADFNSDGLPDVVVANHGSSNISVLLGNGDGTFRSAEHFAVGWTPVGTAVGDFNGDGKTDVVVANHDSSNVSILMNRPPAPRFRVTARAQEQAGNIARVTATALDAWNRTDAAYTGTVRLTSSDGQADIWPVPVLGASMVGLLSSPPAPGPFLVASALYSGRTVLWKSDCTFKAEDNGVHELLVIFNTPGAQTLAVTDSLSPSRQGSVTVVVEKEWRIRVRVEAPARSEPGKAFMATVTFLDGSDKPITGYLTTVHFTATDALAELPNDFLFRHADRGVHSFPVTFKTLGNHTLSVSDTQRPAIVGGTTVRILEAGRKEPNELLPPK